MEQAKQSQSRNKKGRAKTKVVADLGASSPTPTPEEDDVNARDDNEAGKEDKEEDVKQAETRSVISDKSASKSAVGGVMSTSGSAAKIHPAVASTAPSSSSTVPSEYSTIRVVTTTSVKAQNVVQIPYQVLSTRVAERWIKHMIPLSMESLDLSSDFRNGTILLQLLETITKHKIPGWVQMPTTEPHRIHNLVIALRVMKSLGIGVPFQLQARGMSGGDESSSSSMCCMDCLNGYWSRVHGTIHSLTLWISELEAYARAQRAAGQSGGGAWGWDQVPSGPLLTRFQDGRLLCWIVQACVPSMTNTGNSQNSYALSKDNLYVNFRIALLGAQQHLKVPLLFDLDDVMKEPLDLMSLVMYLCTLWQAVHDRDEAKKQLELQMRASGTQQKRENDLLSEIAELKASKNKEMMALKEKKSALENDLTELQKSCKYYKDENERAKSKAFSHVLDQLKSEFSKKESLLNELRQTVLQRNEELVVFRQAQSTARRVYREDVLASTKAQLDDATREITMMQNTLASRESATEERERLHNAVLDKLKIQMQAVNDELQDVKQRYFYSCALGVKMNEMATGKSIKQIDLQVLFENVLERKLPIESWPKEVRDKLVRDDE